MWHDLKQSIHARKPSNVAELKQFCKEEWEDSSTAMWKTLCQLSQTLDCSCCCPGDAQPVIRFRGQLLFHVGPGRFGQPFSLNKWNHYFKTAFCIYSGYLCVILKLVWRSESFKCDKCANGHSGEKKIFDPLLILYVCPLTKKWSVYNFNGRFIWTGRDRITTTTKNPEKCISKKVINLFAF